MCLIFFGKITLHGVQLRNSDNDWNSYLAVVSSFISDYQNAL